jgi:hypothetical protein
VWVVVFNTISGERPSLSIVLSTLLASVGVLIATYTDTSVDALGVITALASAAIAGLDRFSSSLCKQAPVGWLVGWLVDGFGMCVWFVDAAFQTILVGKIFNLDTSNPISLLAIVAPIAFVLLLPIAIYECQHIAQEWLFRCTRFEYSVLLANALGAFGLSMYAVPWAALCCVMLIRGTMHVVQTSSRSGPYAYYRH